MIYFDHAATSYHKPKEVAEAVYHALLHTGNSGRGVHQVSLDTSRQIYETREKIASLFGVGSSSRVVFTSGATESLNIVIQGLLEEGDRCITSCMEHNSVLRPLHAMEKRGVKVNYISLDENGKLDYALLNQYLEEKPKMFILTHASNVTGAINELASIGKRCKELGIVFVVDASQTAGLIPIHMEEWGISALCFSAHKSMLGPQGIGVLCLGEGIRPQPLLFGGTGMDSFSKGMNLPLPTYLEAGTPNAHSIAGLSAAIDYIERYGQEVIYKEAMAFAQLFQEAVENIAGISIYGGDKIGKQTPVVALNLRDIDAAELEDELAVRFEIATRAGAHCAPLMHERLGTKEQGIVRFSFSHLNTEEEVKCAIEALRIIEEETR